MEVRLKKYYKDTVVSEMMKKLKIDNSMQIPRITKIVLNMGVGKDNKDAKAIEAAQKDLTLISGQKPVIKKAKNQYPGLVYEREMSAELW